MSETPDPAAFPDVAEDFDAVQRIANIGSWHLLPGGSFRWSKQACAILGIPEGAPVSYEQFLNIIHPSDRPAVDRAWHGARSGQPYRLEFRIILESGTTKWVRETATLVLSESGDVVSGTGTVQDITEQKQAESELHLHHAVFENVQEGIVITNPNGTIVDVNRAWTELTGYSRSEAVGKTPALLKSGKHDAVFYRHMWAELNRTGYWRGEVWNARRSGDLYLESLSISSVRAEDGTVSHFIGTTTDITDRKTQEDLLRLHANHDVLTGLPNRAFFSQQLEKAISEMRRYGGMFAVCFIDLDGFKPVNDQLGHKAGDQLLCEVANRMRRATRETDVVARIGGDEFVILIRRTHTLEECVLAANRLLNAIQQPYSLQGSMVAIGGSVGVAVYPNDATDGDLLMRQADQAMYAAKSDGKGRVRFFHEHAEADRRKAAESEQLVLAVSRNEFLMHYQPIVDFGTGDVVSVEALARWQHADRGTLFPGEFLSLVEQGAAALPFVEWSLFRTFTDWGDWQADGANVPTVSVNLSFSHLRNPEFVPRVKSLLARFPDADPHRIRFEIKESTATDGLTEILLAVNRLRTLGIRIDVDNFGLGHSSLSHLRQLPISALKINLALVDAMMGSVEDLNFAESIIGLAHAFGADVVAEGVSTVGQAELLGLLGCPMGQGYLISRPLRSEDVPKWIHGYREQPIVVPVSERSDMLERIRRHLNLIAARNDLKNGAFSCENTGTSERLGCWIRENSGEFGQTGWFRKLSERYRTLMIACSGLPEGERLSRSETNDLSELVDAAYAVVIPVSE